MKKINHILTATLVLISFGSCKDYLDTKPTDFNVASNYYQNKQQLEFALAGIYSGLKNTPLGANVMDINVPTDEGYYYNGTQTGPTTFSNTPDIGIIGSYWTECYKNINYANTMLDNLGRSTGIDQESLDFAKGEAMFMRAYYYFLLVQFFGDIPMPLKATSSVNDAIIEETPAKLVYDQIIADMTIAEGLLQNRTSAAFPYAERATVDVVQGILARVCLYAAGEPVNDTKRYADALKWALKVKESNRHSLNVDFRQIFINYMQDKYELKESMWEVGYGYFGPTSTVNIPGAVGVNVAVRQQVQTVLGLDTGYAFGYTQIHPRLYKAYSPSDIRRNWTVGNYIYSSNTTAPNNAIWKSPLSPTQLWERYPAKYRREYEAQSNRSNSRTATTANFPILRYADVLLMLAEAENEVNGPTALAYEAINTVRRRSIKASPTIDEINVTNIGLGYPGIPTVSVSGGGGTGAVFEVNLNPANRSVALVLRNQGTGYTSSPTITISSPVGGLTTPWAAQTDYIAGTQINSGGRTYTVTAAGKSTNTAPTNTSGSSAAGTTGAVFTVPVQATATASIGAAPSVDLSGLNKDTFKQAVRDERYRELAFECLRLGDLRRWGILVSTIKGLVNDINGLRTAEGIPAAPASFQSPAIAPVTNISDRDVFWPIPATNINYNPKLTQNLGF
ncbi:RagB/SusD family nutrient uptake outer membrane protein [Pedobacter sp. MC2016-24]|uniref:RagB/SusD family nutrient uptake outer membrane protein n=1 Tax=Pedobacter sp. MC2016-24 TaxID=2780090 RepID=UPI00187E2BE0|nr:RagB/SusD family nutrient uptake outer membrane protein [Pedobacter sp. MC2016-24]MBE9599822.1 RagB/SusD family nutrient uptake outer membrane protein [Pedobacter sp. MC2016-24]